MTMNVQERSTFEALDDAFHLLRELPASAWVTYLTGAVPFLLALLWTAAELTVLYSPAIGLQNSLLCAFAFVWMQFWRVRFAESLELQLRGIQPEPWTAPRTFHCVCAQAGFQSVKLVLLPLAAFIVLPFTWLALFFRNLTVLVSRPPVSLSELLRQAARLASPNHKQAWLLLAMIFVMAFFVFLNVGILLLILPALTKALSGYENQFTRGTGNPFTWRLLETACGFTWLLIDPLLQAVAVERIYAIEATASGADLLRSLRKPVMVIAALACALGVARADVAPPVLQQNIEQVLQQRQYSWQHRGKADADAPLGFMDRMARSVRDAGRKLGEAIDVFGDWLKRIFANNPEDTPVAKGAKAPASVRWTMSALAGVIAIALIIFFVRGRRAEPVPMPEPIVTTVNLEDESVGAADLPEDGWLRLAQDCVGRQEYRLALRALYLATLAHLGQRQLLNLANTKTNRDYERELRRRSPNQQLQNHFRESVLYFEAAWYGRHETGESQVAQYRLNFDAVRTNAE